jgi:hypothetical protein
VLRSARKVVDLLWVGGVRLHKVAHDIQLVLPHRQLQRRHAMPRPRLRLYAQLLKQILHHGQGAVPRGVVKRPAARRLRRCAARRRVAFTLGVGKAAMQQ